MWKEMRVYVAVAALPILCAIVFIAIKVVRGARVLQQAERNQSQRAMVIRHPNPTTPKSQDTGEAVHNIAPLAIVTVSSVEESAGSPGTQNPVGAVADGAVDTKEWVTREQMGGAWIKLSWDRPARVTELALYDRPNRLENVLSGTLSFDDGSLIAVPALPPGGTPWHITIPPKIVHWVMFRIDRAEGKNTGLEKIMVFGTMNP